jgi:AcrR family transcriptional regulator
MTGPTDPDRAVRFVPPRPPRTLKAADTRGRLLEVAAELFIERGYNAVSMRDIAAAATLTKGAIYGHFRSKGQLLVEVIRWKLAARDHSPHFRELLTDFERAIVLMYDESGRQIRLLEVDAAAAARHDPDVEAGLADQYRERLERIRAGVSAVSDPEMMAWLIFVLSAGIAMNQATGLPLPDAERLRTTILASLRSLI